MNLVKQLSIGDRKELGRSKQVAAFIEKSADHLEQIFQILTDNKGDDPIVSHGFYALKEVSNKNPLFRTKIIKFCIKKLNEFPQWEAGENFLRILLIDVGKNSQAYKLSLKLSDSSSAIVQAYAAEYIIRYHYQFDKKTLNDIIQDLEHKSNKASVKARIRKIRRKLKI